MNDFFYNFFTLPPTLAMSHKFSDSVKLLIYKEKIAILAIFELWLAGHEWEREEFGANLLYVCLSQTRNN